jgi:transcription elongation factor Elf1
MPDQTITCLACAHEANVGPGPALEEGVFVCSECGARMAYGKLAPRIVVEPFVDAMGREWVRYRFQDASTKREAYSVDLDPQHAAMVAKTALVLVIP